MTMTRIQFLEEMKMLCGDFWGEKKTRKAIKDAWISQLDILKDDGYEVDMKWKPTKEELDLLMNVN